MIVVISDDLSGAAELAGVALRHGLTAEVQTELSWETKAEVVCVDTDTRSLSRESAAQVVRAVAERAVAGRPDWIFKKCDSVLRGPVLAEAKAVAKAAGKTQIVILSANPSRGRVIRDGQYFVDGVLLHETNFMRDPSHPRKTSSVAEMLDDDLTDVRTPDVETPEDVANCAAALDEATLAVGAADFFQALLQLRSSGSSADLRRGASRREMRDTLLVCGSAASWKQRRAEALSLNIPVFAMPYDVSAAAETLRSSHGILIGIGDEPATRGVSPCELSVRLAEAVARILREANVTCLLSEGGATTAAILRAMGWTRLEATEVVGPGVGAMRPIGANGPLLLIKPGSYAWPREIWPPIAFRRPQHPDP